MRPPDSALPFTLLVLSCEHGGNRVPAEYAGLFAGQEALLNSHRGYDPGALEMARAFAEALSAPLYFSEITRLLVEANRSLGNRHSLFSPISAALDPSEKQRILQHYYLPYRSSVEHAIAQAIAAGERVLHLSLHSFTPVLNGLVRRADVGILYDPARQSELRTALAWQRALQEARPGLVVRRNYPYRGTSDGFTTWLRRRFPDGSYAGLELEVNQKYPLGERQEWLELQEVLIGTLRVAGSG